MDLTRREFIAASVAPVIATGSGCTGRQEDGPEELYFSADLDRAPVKLDGEDIYVNMQSFAEGEDLQENRIEYQEPGEQVWNVLDSEEVQGSESAMSESYTTDTPGEYRFRSVVEAGGESYTSETEVVEFVDEIEDSF
jgi:hypothetical protein